ncbi:MAG: hypothetical protein F6J86_40515, partial [Symploca sp. SIO1B1]|nr:hypothetical protein [Symploca sp. SIO1B1]
ENPRESDRAAIEQLNRAQRDALIEALISAFNPNRSPVTTPTPTPTASPSPIPTPKPRVIPALPQPGDSRLLRP